MSQLVINAVGPDRPGLVGELTAHFHAAGANILDSRMVNLRGQFAVIVLIEAEDAALGKLGETLPAVGKSMGLTISITSATAAPTAVAGVPYKIKTYSLDQPGIVHCVSEVLRKHRVNIEDLSARQDSAPFAGSPLFILEMRITVPAGVSVRTLRAELESACAALNCDLDMVPA